MKGANTAKTRLVTPRTNPEM